MSDVARDSEAESRPFWARLAIALVPLLFIYLAAWGTGVADHIDAAGIRDAIAPQGRWALPLFVGLYGLGIVAQVPGSVFVGAGVLVFGPVVGGLASYAGALWGNVLSFALVRMAGFSPTPPRNPWVRRNLERLDRHQTWSVLVVRVVFPSTAPVNYLLALSGVRWSPYLLGSAVGVLPQLVATVVLFASLFAQTGQ